LKYDIICIYEIVCDKSTLFSNKNEFLKKIMRKYEVKKKVGNFLLIRLDILKMNLARQRVSKKQEAYYFIK
jgi:hypothetical protein